MDPLRPRGRGNPNWRKGVSANPGGRAAGVDAFRERCRKAVDEHVIDAWVNEVETGGRERIRAGELLAAYGYGRPAQTITGPDEGPIQVVVLAAELTDDELASIVAGAVKKDQAK